MSEPKICPVAILYDSKDVMNCFKEKCMAYKTIQIRTPAGAVLEKDVCVILRAIEKWGGK